VTDISITVINVQGILFICVCLMQRLTTAPLDNHLNGKPHEKNNYRYSLRPDHYTCNTLLL